MRNNDFADFHIDLSNCKRNDTVDAIHDALVNWLENNRVSQGRGQLPSVSYIAQSAGVAWQTVDKAYQRLASDYGIYRKQGERKWRIKRMPDSGMRRLAYILPCSIHEYCPLGTGMGQRHAKIIFGMIDQAMCSGCFAVPCELPPPDTGLKEAEEAVQKLVSRYDGIIHLGDRGYRNDLVLDTLLSCRSIPQISIDCDSGRPWVGVVTFDPVCTAKLAMESFHEFGHRKICIILSTAENNLLFRYTMHDPDSVVQPFLKAGLRRENLSVILTKGVYPEQQDFEEKLKQEIQSDNPPDAFWCRGDTPAQVLYQTLKKWGYGIPDDFSIIGFENAMESNSESVITTVSNPQYLLGAEAIKKIIIYRKQSVSEIERISYLPTNLISRNSVGIAKRKMKI